MISFFLERVYVKGSLRNLDLDNDGKVDAFSFKLSNPFPARGSVSRLSLTVDNEEIEKDKIILKMEGKELKASEISSEKPLEISPGGEVEVVVLKEGGLKEGKHSLSLKVFVDQLGSEYTLSFEDEIK